MRNLHRQKGSEICMGVTSGNEYILSCTSAGQDSVKPARTAAGDLRVEWRFHKFWESMKNTEVPIIQVEEKSLNNLSIQL